MTLQDKIHHTEQMANAIQRREEYYTIVGTQVRHIELPAPQVAGTMGQQRSYAVGRAMDILQNLSL
jgi:hypothetical protein